MRTLEIYSLAAFLTAFSTLGHAAPPLPNTEQVEVPIGQVFIPPQGYDENDNIQFVLDGTLPNGCYHIANEDLQTDPTNKRIEARLWAFQRIDSVCADQANLPASLQAPVPYTLQVSVGRLAPGAWQIGYSRPNHVQGIRPFSIEPARLPSMDNPRYAATSSIWIPDTVRGDLPMSAELIGSLTSTCSFLMPDVSVKLIDDVFVVLQTVGFKTDVLCAMLMVPFQRTIQLGTVGQGRYMIHVRSMNGRSVDRVFSSVVPTHP